jgi:hypothetical protein
VATFASGFPAAVNNERLLAVGLTLILLISDLSDRLIGQNEEILKGNWPPGAVSVPFGIREILVLTIRLLKGVALLIRP